MSARRIGPLVVAALLTLGAELTLIGSAAQGPTHSLSFHEDGLYATIIDTVYGKRATRVFLEQHTQSAAQALADSAVQATLRSMLGAAIASETVAAYQARNAHPVGLGWGIQADDRYVLLDSTTAEQFLASDAARTPLRGTPGILVVSQPGFATRGPVALVHVTLRAPASRTVGHVSSAAFLVLRWNGVRWTVTHEIPDPTG
jgi:hypothetical protein